MPNRMRADPGANHAALMNRFGSGPLLLSLEHVARWPLRDAKPDESRQRAQHMVRAALGKRADAGEWKWVGITCGYFLDANGLAIVPIWGDMGPARAFWPWVWYEDLAATAEAASKDADVKGILFHIDSPGGHVTGLAQCASAIAAAAALKPCAAFADDYATSAAYWVASATGRISAPPSGVLCSIGAIAIHAEGSRAYDEMGVTFNLIRSAPRKAEANPFEPLSQAARMQLQAEVGACAEPFIDAVAALRKLDRDAVLITQAACLTASEAHRAGFADAIETFDEACTALLERAASAAAAALTPATPAASAKAKARSAKQPARGKSAKPKPPARAAAKRKTAMDPTELEAAEQAARRDEIATIVAEPAEDEATKASQFVAVAEVVNRPAEGDDEAVDEAEEAAAAEGDDDEDEGEGDDKEARARLRRALKNARAIARSSEAKANPIFALSAIAGGVSLKQFKALAPAAGNGKGGLAQRMEGEDGARRLGSDAPASGGSNGRKVVQLKSPRDYYAACEGDGKKTG